MSYVHARASKARSVKQRMQSICASSWHRQGDTQHMANRSAQLRAKRVPGIAQRTNERRMHACFRLDTPNRAQASPADLAVAVRIMRAFSDRVLFGFARILYLRRNPLQDGKTLQSGNSNVIDRT